MESDTRLADTLTLPRARVASREQLLFPNGRVLCGAGAARSFVGEFFEEATAAVSAAVRLKTDSRLKVCPDLCWRPGTFFESKGVGCSRQVILYRDRVAKDRRWCKAHDVRLHYWLWCHRAAPSKHLDLEGLRDALVGGLFQVVIIDSPALWRIIRDRPVRCVNSGAVIKTGPYAGKKLGYGKPGYGFGWTVSVKDILASCAWDGTIDRPLLRDVYGRAIPCVPVRCSQRLQLAFLKG